ncbi:MAG TPA: ABC transporter permease [Pyrinomonadaceae bacterium]|nr:ABC transporter permease [Pyrinomonadaceae bacterium]
MNSLLLDLRYGLRVLLRRPGFAFVTILTLALGVGANTAIFSVVNGALLRPLPYRDAERVMTLWQNDIKAGKERDDASPANFIDWRERAESFEEMAALEPFGHNLTGQGEPEAFRSWLATEGFFRVMGADALHGRTFLPEEHAPGAPPAVVLGHGLWQRRFGGDPGVVGRPLLLNGRPHTVVGVMPPEFDFPAGGGELWAARALTERERQNRGSSYWQVVGRLKPGATVEQARAEMESVAAQLAQEYPQTNGAIRATVVPLREQLIGHIRPALLVLLAAVGAVLLIACANVANLLLARGTERRREFAVRNALGAARSRLVRQLLTESFVIALAGGVGGVLLSRWLVDVMLAFAPEGLLGTAKLGLDWRVLSFALGATALTAVLFGLLPALQSSRPDLAGALKETQRTAAGGPAGLRNALVVAEIAMALVLLVGAGLLVRSFVGLLRVDPGFAADKIAALEVHVWGKYRTPEQRRNFFGEAIERLGALPGVEGAGAVSSLPFVAMDSNTPFDIEGRPAPPAGEGPSAYAITATTDYFRAMNIPLREGRFFAPTDREDTTPVVVINETMARRHWPGESPLGRKITSGEGEERTTYEIVGVVGDVRHDGLDSEPRPEFFATHAQDSSGSMIFVVRTKGDPQSLLQAAKKEVWAVNKDIPFSRAVTMNQLVAKSLGERRFTLLLFGSFAALSLLLAAVGIYGLVSFTTGQRTHEIGIRVALGAGRADIVRMILKQGLWLVLAGVGAGLAAAFALTRFLGGMLYGVSATDPVTFSLPALLLCLVALAACYLPARRATKVDPMEALRYE